MDENISKFWSLTFHCFKNDIKKPEDNLMILVHWLMLKNNFQILGSGSETEINENEQATDILPTNWSQEQSYKLRYVRDKKLFLLNGINACGGFIFNIYNVTTEALSSAAIGNINTIVQYISNVVNNEVNFQETVEFIHKTLIDPLINKDVDKTNTVQTQTKDFTHFADDKTNKNLPQDILKHLPIDYGRRDLDPLGRLHRRGEGMIFDPAGVGNSRPRIYPGVHPMARFDPLQPPNPDPMLHDIVMRRDLDYRRPDLDHMRPPNFEDDMFM